MTTLGEIPGVLNNINVAPVVVIKKLHKLIFGQEGDRNNRKRLREFAGFEFEKDSEEYRSKLRYAINNFSISDLTSFANILHLNYDKEKEELVEDICKSLADLKVLQEHRDETENEEEEGEEEEDDVASQVSSCVSAHNMPQFSMNFRDVEDSIKQFDGSGTYPIEKWIQDLEDMSTLMGWSELHLFIFAKKSLTGLAKLFIQSERGIKSWKTLKKALKDEYSSKLNSAQIHKLLTERKLKKNETVQEYFLIMKELAGRGDIENDALFHYVIDGIQDEQNNKIVLYGAKSIVDFKQKLKVYSEIKAKTSQHATYSPSSRTVRTKNDSKPDSKQNTKSAAQNIRCFNCGIKGHKSNECQSKNLGTKCFKCNKFGHKSNECQVRKEDHAVATTSVNKIRTVERNKMHKEVHLNDVPFNALIDTGSSVNLVTLDTYKKIGAPNLKKSDILLSGFGKSNTETLGNFECQLVIDGDQFETKVYVVPNEAMTVEVIIGNELLSKVELTISPSGIKIVKVVEDENIKEKDIMKIDVIETNEIDIGQDLKEEVREKIEKMVKMYKPEKVKTTNMEMKIIVKDEEPVYCSPRRLPFAERKIVDDQVEQWIQDGIVEPCSSEYASQVVVTKKKCGSPRICIDYRKLNKKVVRDRHPLPLIEDQLDRLQDAKVFTTIDLKNGFFHVTVEKGSRKYTAFVTHQGQFQFIKVPFGLCNSPAVFQRFINNILRELMARGIALPYIDDIIVPASDEEEAVERLSMVLQVAKEYGLEINIRKCQFVKRSVEFLGYRIEGGKIFPSQLKTKAVMEFPKPTTAKQIQSFLGLTGYFRKFIPFYSIVAKPLTDLLKKDSPFRFGENETNAYNQLKKILSERPVLTIYRQGAEMELHTDASADGFGAILLQRSPEDNFLHPIYYASKKTTEAQRKYTSYELEVLAIVEALKKFRTYLLGYPFKIITDCLAFQKTMSKKDLSTRIARWALFLEDYDYQIEHRSGSRMRHVDALSRFPIMIVSDDMTETMVSKIRKFQNEDREIRAIKEVLKDKPYEDYILKDGVVYKMINDEEMMVVPKQAQIEVIRRAHELGHFSVKKTAELLKKEYHIPKVREKIEKVINSCIPCILANRKRGKQEGFLHPLHKESLPLHTYHIDHLGPLESTSKRYRHILAIIDSFTKFVWLYPTKSTSAKEVIEKLEIQRKTFGSPANLISDRGTAFTAKEFQDYCAEHQINHFKITTGLPRSNGQVERINSIIIPVLTKLSLSEPTKWYKHVDELQRVINSTYQRSIKTTPFELLTGVKMKTNKDLKVKEMLEEEIQKIFEENRDEIRREAKEQIKKVQEENRKGYNLRRRSPRRYQVGELVAIKRTQLGPGLKLRPKFLGPYKITKAKRNDTYDVQKEGYHEGPMITTTCAEYVKPWISPEDESATSETDEEQEGRDVGTERVNQPYTERVNQPDGEPRQREMTREEVNKTDERRKTRYKTTNDKNQYTNQYYCITS